MICEKRQASMKTRPVPQRHSDPIKLIIGTRDISSGDEVSVTKDSLDQRDSTDPLLWPSLLGSMPRPGMTVRPCVNP